MHSKCIPDSLCASECVCVCLCVVLSQYFPLVTGFQEGDYQRNAGRREIKKKRVLWLEAQFMSHLPIQPTTHIHSESLPTVANQHSCVVGKHTSVDWQRSLTQPESPQSWQTDWQMDILFKMIFDKFRTLTDFFFLYLWRSVFSRFCLLPLLCKHSVYHHHSHQGIDNGPWPWRLCPLDLGTVCPDTLPHLTQLHS